MKRYLGKVACGRREPVIYFIFLANYLYIGETENHPVMRWGDHLNNGTFINKLNVIDRNIILSQEDIVFSAFECTYIKNEVPDLHKNYAVKFTEHWLHIFIRTRINTVNKKLGKNIQLISDVPSTPRFFQDEKCIALAESIFTDFLDYCE